MAEILGIASGIAGIVSLAIQIGDGAIKLKTLCGEYQDAPAMLDGIAFDMQTQVLMLQRIQREMTTYKPSSDDSEILTRCLKSCHIRLDALRKTIAKCDSSMRQSRVRGRLRTVCAKSDILKFRSDLQEAKSELALACQLFFE